MGKQAEGAVMWKLQMNIFIPHIAAYIFQLVFCVVPKAKNRCSFSADPD